MLVLSRKLDESIMIGDDVVLVVVEIRGDKVRLGVDAPREVPVHRREIYDAIARGDRPQPPEIDGSQNGNGHNGRHKTNQARAAHHELRAPTT